MELHGLQKLTLLDYPEHVACTVFLNGCDFRCPFCHNFSLADGTAPAVMTEEELLRFLDKRHGLLDGVAITGGEPLLHRDLPELLARIREMGFKIKLDTNGYHPDRLEDVLARGLADYVAMDIKNSRGKYARTAGLERIGLDRIDRSIRLLNACEEKAEFRTTVIDGYHDEDDFREIGAWLSGTPRPYYLQPFADRDSVPVRGLRAPDPEKLRTFLEILRQSGLSAQLRGESV